MGKIYYIMGKSSSGKDTIYKELLSDLTLDLKTVVSYTTRPIRQGEENGTEYIFSNEQELKRLEEAGKVIEVRAYNTFHGVWKYFTVDDSQMDLNSSDYLMIGTLESYLKTRTYYGPDKMVPILIELDDGERLMRAIKREKEQPSPRYEELCRRFLADSADFAEEKIEAAGITRRFQNQSLEQCLADIKEYIRS